MPIIGDLADMGLPDLLYIFKLRGTTGRLALQRGGDEAVLYLQQGRLIQVASSQLAQSLGELLVRQGKLTEPQLALAREWQATDQQTLAQALEWQTADPPAPDLAALLVSQGLLSAADLADSLVEQAVLILHRVLAWSDGTFAYTPAPPPVALVPLPELNLEQIILEAFRQADERAAPSGNGVLRRKGRLLRR
jgi:hypothetical protein